MCAADVPDFFWQKLGFVRRVSARLRCQTLNGRDIQMKLRSDLRRAAIGTGAERERPCAQLFSRGRLGNIDHEITASETRHYFAHTYEKHAVAARQKSIEPGEPFLVTAVQVLGIEKKRERQQATFALPQSREQFEIGRLRR